MKVVLKNIKRTDQGQVKRALKKNLTPFPAVSVKNGSERVVAVTVTKGPKDPRERESLGKNIDAILMRHGYQFCNITHN